MGPLKPPTQPHPPSPSLPQTTLPLDLDPGQASNNYSFTFTEGDSATAITVASGTSLADVDSSSFDKVTVAFSQANFADGASESLNINGASLGGTISNLGGLSNGDTGTFTLSSVVYDFSVAVGSGTATISFTGDSGAELSTAEAEALLDSLRYNNSSDNPTASSDRVLSINAFDGAAQTSNTATSTITVAAANDAPTLDLDPGQASNNYSFTFTEGDSQRPSPSPREPHSPMSIAPPSTRSPSPSLKPTLPTAPANLSTSMVHPSAAPSQTSAVYPTETQAHSHSAPLSTTSP